MQNSNRRRKCIAFGKRDRPLGSNAGMLLEFSKDVTRKDMHLELNLSKDIKDNMNEDFRESQCQ